MRRFTLIVLGMILAGGAAALGVRAAAQAAPGVSGEPVEIARCLVTIFEHVQVPVREAGQLESLLVREGDLVAVGQELGQVDSELPRIERTQAEYELEVARKQAENDVNVRFAAAAWEVAKAHLLRAEEANRKVPGSIPEAEVEERRLAAEKAKLQIEQSKHELDVAKITQKGKTGLVDLTDAKLRRRTISAPIKGVVVEVFKKPGEWLNPGDPVVRVLRMDRLRVEGFLSADRSAAAKAGTAITVESVLADGRREKFAGNIMFVSPEVEAVTNQVRVWAEVENPRLLLRPGSQASMTIVSTPAP